jgi:hypothetical protein
MLTAAPASQAADQIASLVDEAVTLAESLAACLRLLSDAHWGDQVDAPLFKASPATLTALEDMADLIQAPIDEIQVT